ncbi:bacterial Ig-like domain family protein, partial [Vibrio parahaemolyticus VPTS-2010]
AKLSSESLR